MAQNRNSLRSINMIKTSFLEILKTKDISKISVKEITEKANLTRNTFYNHFIDVYSVNEALEDDLIDKTLEFIDDYFSSDIITNSYSFFESVLNYINSDKEMLLALLNHGTSNFINKFSHRILEHVFNNLKNIKFVDKEGFKIFLEILLTGATYIIRQYLVGEINLSLKEITNILNNIFLNSYKSYIKE